jgi:hypothetical protein
MKKRMAIKKKPKLTPYQIDNFVVAQADDEFAWESPQTIRRKKSIPVSLPADLATRAIFLAKIHHESTVDKWIERIVRERVEIEESAFSAAKKKLTAP